MLEVTISEEGCQHTLNMHTLCPVKHRNVCVGGWVAVLGREEKPILSQPAPDITLTVKPSSLPPFRVNYFFPTCFRAFSLYPEGRINGRSVLSTTKLLN